MIRFFNPKRENVLIYDLDGCVVNSQERFQRNGGLAALATGEYNEFRKSMIRYATDYYDDEPLQFGIEMLEQMRKQYNVSRMIALTARGEEGRENTMTWLREHMPWEVDGNLEMRPAYTEYEPGVFWKVGEPKFDAVEFKKNFALQAKTKYNVVLAVDDHQDIAHAYWEVGIPAICLMIPGVNQGTRMQSAISGVVQG
jgi:hypothetical protein